jgi:hypothetical protein
MHRAIDSVRGRAMELSCVLPMVDKKAAISLHQHNFRLK